MEKQFVVSHIHGQLRTLERLIGLWEPKKETLIVLGDNNDYGPNSFLVYKRLLQLKQEFGERVIFLKGKHELMFEKFQANPSIYAQDYFDNGGAATLASFYHKGLSYEELNDSYYLINEVLPEIDFTELSLYLSQCLPVHETHYCVFLSEELGVLKNQLIKDWGIVSSKKMVFSSKGDIEFKLDYFSRLAKETIYRDCSSDCFYFDIKREFDLNQLSILSFKAKETIELEEQFKPLIVAYRLGNGVVLNEFKLRIEE